VKPKKPQALNKAAKVMRNVASAELNKNMGKFKTGPNANPATKRSKTRSAAKTKAVEDFKE
jgi:hypothetical protein